MSFVTPPPQVDEATSSTTLDQPVDGSTATDNPTLRPEPPVGGVSGPPGSFGGIHWSQLPEDMIFRFASPGHSEGHVEATAEHELLSQADQDSENLAEDSSCPATTGEHRFSFAEPPPGAQRGGQSIIPPGRRARGPLQQLRTTAGSPRETTDVYILDKDWSAWYTASQAFGETWKKS